MNPLLWALVGVFGYLAFALTIGKTLAQNDALPREPEPPAVGVSDSPSGGRLGVSTGDDALDGWLATRRRSHE